jgi:hypothetical protein
MQTKEILESVDAFMSGEALNLQQVEMSNSAFTAAAFAAAAYEAHTPKSGGECHALLRAFLLALIDPLHPDLDYLRERPDCADTARSAMDTINSIIRAGEANQ